MQHKEFEAYVLNETGIQQAQAVAHTFDLALTTLVLINPIASREMSIVRTKLEEACFFAKKAVANNPINWKND